MSRPPKSHRRTHRRRRTAIAATLAALLVAGGLEAWPSDDFPARSLPLTGTTAELRVQSGVTARDLRAVRSGVRVMNRYLRGSLGRGVLEPVDVRVAREDPCGSSKGGERSVIGEGGAGFTCVDTENVEWDVLVSSDMPAAAAVSAHEYVHAWQAELGCLPAAALRDYRWLAEGMATDLAWRAMVAAHRATDARVHAMIVREGAFDDTSGPLRFYEAEGGRPPQYALWHAAIRSLLRHSAKRPVALRDFCRRVGDGASWRAAFLRTFGLPVDRFYAVFERERAAAPP